MQDHVITRCNQQVYLLARIINRIVAYPIRKWRKERKMKNYRNLSLLALGLLLLTSACNLPFLDTGLPLSENVDQEEIVLGPEEINSAEYLEMGSITINVVNTFDDGTSTINCDTLQTLYLPFDQHFPGQVSKMKVPDNIECEASLFRSGYTTATTSATIPVTYTFDYEFTPKPRCDLKIQVDILYAFSQVTMLHDSALGDIPVEGGLGEDYFQSVPAHIFTLPGEKQTIIEDMVTLSITPDDFVIPAWTGCTYQY
jgi:hypothetical protein